ncbi:hypothetical protein AMECASPLE_013160 [Ameca splendens]|uniref:Uncharacterized protein n=1 Tax=Ameca splendens TaxID=208324 RepID=A0ABV0ZA47_9TELE
MARGPNHTPSQSPPPPPPIKSKSSSASNVLETTYLTFCSATCVHVSVQTACDQLGAAGSLTQSKRSKNSTVACVHLRILKLFSFYFFFFLLCSRFYPKRLVLFTHAQK